MRNDRVYLAGPEVFLPDADEIFRRKKEICSSFSLVGVSPLDDEVTRAGLPAARVARAIYRANRRSMRTCGACVANVTPFRGVGVDAGTAFEVGFMVAAGAVVFGYSHDREPYRERVEALCADNPAVAAHVEGGWSVEDFGLAENLMLPFGMEESGGALLSVQPEEGADRFRALAGFRACVERLAATATSSPAADA